MLSRSFENLPTKPRPTSNIFTKRYGAELSLCKPITGPKDCAIYYNFANKKAAANVRVQVRGNKVRVEIEQPGIRTVVPITAEKAHTTPKNHEPTPPHSQSQ